MTARERPRARTTSLLGPLILLIVFRLLQEKDPANFTFLFAYALLFIATILYADVWSSNNPRERHLLRIEDFTFQAGFRTLIFGVAGTLTLFAVLFLSLGPPRLHARSWWEGFRIWFDM